MWCDLNRKGAIKWNRSLMSFVLTGDYPKTRISRMNRKTLFNFTVGLIKITCGVNLRSNSSMKLKKPVWWPSEVCFDKTFVNILMNNENGQSPAILRNIVAKCCQFYKDRPEFCLPIKNYAEVSSKKNSFNFDKKNSLGADRRNWAVERRILSVRNSNNVKIKKKPLVKSKSKLKLDVKLFSKATKLKRKRLWEEKTSRENCLDSDENLVEETERERSASPIVKLVDIIKHKPIEEPENPPPTKNNFMFYLGLNNSVEPQEKQLSEYVSKFQRLPSYVPFSSEVGQIYLKRENHCNPEFSKLRKLERLEWYLKEIPSTKPQEFEITYNQKKFEDDQMHVYNYPKRQYGQRHVKLKKLLDLCKPVKIVLRNVIEQPEVVLKKNLKLTEINDQLSFSVIPDECF